MAEREARMPKQPSEAARGAGVLWDPTVACRDEHLGGGRVVGAYTRVCTPRMSERRPSPPMFG